MNKEIFVVVVIDDSDPDRPPYQRIPAVFSHQQDAIALVKNNYNNISEDGANRYAAVECIQIDVIEPEASQRIWFEWDAVREEYVENETPHKYVNMATFGIG